MDTFTALKLAELAALQTRVEAMKAANAHAALRKMDFVPYGFNEFNNMATEIEQVAEALRGHLNS